MVLFLMKPLLVVVASVAVKDETEAVAKKVICT
jgi:hypothetical protein